MGQAEGLPQLLSDANSYIYGLSSRPVEQINNSTGGVTYLHHDQQGSTRPDRHKQHHSTHEDQQGSTRLLISSAGAKEAFFTYDAYGNTTGTTGTVKAPLGYDVHAGALRLRGRQPGEFDDPAGLARQYCAGGTVGVGIQRIKGGQLAAAKAKSSGISSGTLTGLVYAENHPGSSSACACQGP